MFEREYFAAPGPYRLESVGIERRREGRDCAVVAQVSLNGARHEVHGMGNGPIEAFVAALTTLGGQAFEIADYTEHASAPGAHAQAVAYVAVQIGPTVRYGAGRHEDVVLATFHAIVSAYNRTLTMASVGVAAML